MLVKINGEDRELPNGTTTVSQLLALYKIKAEKAAVELNGRIIISEQFAHTELNDRDTLEVVSFVGGG